MLGAVEVHGQFFAPLRSLGLGDASRRDQRSWDRRTVGYFADLAASEFGLDVRTARSVISILLSGVDSLVGQMRSKSTAADRGARRHLCGSNHRRVDEGRSPRVKPTLVIISGPAGSGKTTLAHELAHAIGCPAICRDEIKEGMVQATGGFDAAPGDTLTERTLPLFFEVVRLLLEGGVTVVAEAAFQDHVWRPNLAPLGDLADLRIVQCHTDPDTARQRMRARAPRTAHADASVVEDPEYFARFSRVALDVPSIDVDTTSGYTPSIEQLAAFVNAG